MKAFASAGVTKRWCLLFTVILNVSGYSIANDTSFMLRSWHLTSFYFLRFCILSLDTSPGWSGCAGPSTHCSPSHVWHAAPPLSYWTQRNLTRMCWLNLASVFVLGPHLCALSISKPPLTSMPRHSSPCPPRHQLCGHYSSILHAPDNWLPPEVVP